MVEPSARLVDRMLEDVRAGMRGEAIDLGGRYRAAIEQVGAVPFLVEVFGRFEDSMLSVWLMATTFVWKDLGFDAWKEVLRPLASNVDALYQFVIFAAEYLAIDILSVIRNDTSLPEAGRAFAARQFSKGGRPPGSRWLREQLQERGVDQPAMWRRLRAEGAPMKVSDHELRSGSTGTTP